MRCLLLILLVLVSWAPSASAYAAFAWTWCVAIRVSAFLAHLVACRAKGTSAPNGGLVGTVGGGYAAGNTPPAIASGGAISVDSASGDVFWFGGKVAGTTDHNNMM
jgi:hypothetical protein